MPRRVERPFHGARETLAVLGLMVIGLHRLDLPQGLTDIDTDIGDPVLALPRQAAHAPAKNEDRRQYQRQRQQHDSGELGVGHEQETDATHQHDAVAQRHGQRRADHRLQQGGIGGQPRLDLRTAVTLEKARVQVDQVIEHLLTDVGHTALANP
ncbi:hypothetical protein D9M71_528930 [compost metagenome]